MTAALPTSTTFKLQLMLQAMAMRFVVEAGTYTSTQDGHVVNMLGKAITLRSSQGADVTIIDGEGARHGIACFNGEPVETVIEGFKITNGFGAGFDYDGNGMIGWLEDPAAGSSATPAATPR